ncbi:MAG: hypothetical protein J0L92_17550 [Deltaproteobacteria bacterium]|nr:hypothetical protein [Deltaproteobacteria bacterium]
MLVAAPVIGFGFTIEALLGGPASDRFGLASLAAGGVGMCAAAGGRADRFARVLVTVLGVLGITLATKVAVEDGALARWVIPAPFVAAALVALVLRPLRPSPEAITSPRDADAARR